MLAFAARGGEGGFQADRAVVVAPGREPLRKRTHGKRSIQNLVVERERLGDGRVLPSETEASQPLTGRSPQACGDRFELGGVYAAGPERLDRALEFAARADARVSEDRAGGK